MNPVFKKERRFRKALFTYLIPLIPALGGWDYLVSALRSYSEAEYREMAEGAGGDYCWEYREIVPFPGAHFAVFWGIPKPSGFSRRSGQKPVE
jgi:hypothetical protein